LTSASIVDISSDLLDDAAEICADSQSAVRSDANVRLLADLFNNHHRELVGFLARRLGDDRSHAGDLAQEAYARIAAYRGVLNREGSRGLLYQIARNLLIDYLRGRQYIPAGDDAMLASVPAPGTNPEDAALAQCELQLLKKAIIALPERCREVYLLHRFDGLSYAQIATQCGVSVSMVEKQMTKAIKRIAEAMGG
jgi:RNA polymerase sigma factor (sigma-70 family)